MPEYLSPGVYFKTVDRGITPVEPLSTSTLGILGESERGPVCPRAVGSFIEYKDLYGEYGPYGDIRDFRGNIFLPIAVEGFFANGGTRCYIARIVKADSLYAQLNILFGNAQVTVKAIGPGTWGNRISVKIENARLHQLDYDLFKLTVAYWKYPLPDKNELNDAIITRKATVVEVYDDLAMVNFENYINGVSRLIEILKPVAVTRRPANSPFTYLLGGKDGNQGQPIRLDDYIGLVGPDRAHDTGLRAFENIEDIALVCAPNEHDFDKEKNNLTAALIDHCEKKQDRFAILQAEPEAGNIDNITPPMDSKYAAFYFPWLRVKSPYAEATIVVPPCGHIAGVYARSDTQHGVHKAPANEVLEGASAAQLLLSTSDQDKLNPRGVNCIRVFPGRGIRIWGARTISMDPIWKYVNVRRLFLFVKKSIMSGMQWVIFEPNDEKLWERITQIVNRFLTDIWKNGGLQGSSPEEAFFIRCDKTTMTPDDIDHGRIVCIIGIAPVKPAEFLSFRFVQWQGGVDASD